MVLWHVFGTFLVRALASLDVRTYREVNFLRFFLFLAHFTGFWQGKHLLLRYHILRFGVGSQTFHEITIKVLIKPLIFLFQVKFWTLSVNQLVTRLMGSKLLSSSLTRSGKLFETFRIFKLTNITDVKSSWKTVIFRLLDVLLLSILVTGLMIRFVLGVHDLIFNPRSLRHFGLGGLLLLKFLLFWLVIGGILFVNKITVDCVEVVIIFGKT